MEKQRVILFIASLVMFLSMVGVAVLTDTNNLKNDGYNLIQTY